jgi:hypothetical protein
MPKMKVYIQPPQRYTPLAFGKARAKYNNRASLTTTTDEHKNALDKTLETLVRRAKIRTMKCIEFGVGADEQACADHDKLASLCCAYFKANKQTLINIYDFITEATRICKHEAFLTRMESFKRDTLMAFDALFYEYELHDQAATESWISFPTPDDVYEYWCMPLQRIHSQFEAVNLLWTKFELYFDDLPCS